MDYNQFTGLTGTNAVGGLQDRPKPHRAHEYCLLTNGFHGVTWARSPRPATATSETPFKVDPQHTTFMPYDGYSANTDTPMFLEDARGQQQRPDCPAVVAETIQGEGGVNEASYDWLRLPNACATTTKSSLSSTISRSAAGAPNLLQFRGRQINPTS